MDKVMLVIFTSKLEVFGHFIIATSIMCYKYHFFFKGYKGIRWDNWKTYYKNKRFGFSF